MKFLGSILLAMLGSCLTKAYASPRLKPREPSASYGTVIAKGDFSWQDTSFIYAFGDSYTFVQGSEGLDTFRYGVPGLLKNSRVYVMSVLASSATCRTSVSRKSNF